MRFISTIGLQPGMVLAKNIVSTEKALMLRQGLILNESTINHLIEQGYPGAYISDIFSEDVEVGEAIADETFVNGMVAVKEGDVSKITEVAAQIVLEVTKEGETSLDLFDLRSVDEYTYHHSVNVAVLAAVVAKAMNLSATAIEEIVQAGLCHDLGKTKVPLEILNKPGKLTDEEFAIIKRHPLDSFEIIRDNNNLSQAVKEAALYHHENENGSGYPAKKIASEIPLYAKIIHVVDVYDALTNKRAYKDPFAPVDALEYIAGGVGMLFDLKVVDALLLSVPAYPRGVDVKLSNGEMALVIAPSSNPRRPKIKIIPSGKVVDLSTDAEYREVEISESGIMVSDYSGEVESLNEDRGEARRKKPLVLAVDDAKMSLMMVTKAIGNEYDVIQLTSGLDALKYLKSGQRFPDVIIIEAEMPVMDGMSTVAKINDLGLPVKIPIVFLTNSSKKETVLRCRLLGAADYILKPVNAVYLKQRLSMILKREGISTY